MRASEKETSREKAIVKTSVIGIIANVLLAAFKAAVGFMANSIAIMLDAVNNISDAASSLITIVGAKLAAKEPDKEHPFGYGRIEYMSAIIIAVIVFYAKDRNAAFQEVLDSVQRECPDYELQAIMDTDFAEE